MPIETTPISGKYGIDPEMSPDEVILRIKTYNAKTLQPRFAEWIVAHDLLRKLKYNDEEWTYVSRTDHKFVDEEWDQELERLAEGFPQSIELLALWEKKTENLYVFCRVRQNPLISGEKA